MLDSYRGHRLHLTLNTLITILLVAAIIFLGAEVFTHGRRPKLSEVSHRVDPVRMRTIVARINLVSPKVSKGDAFEYARVISMQPQYVQPVCMALLERESSPGYIIKAVGAAGERGGMQLLPGTIQVLTRWVEFSSKEIAETIEGNTVGGLMWWQMHYASYGNIAKASSGYNGVPKGGPFPTEYGMDISQRAKAISVWLDSADAAQLSSFNSQTR